MLAMDPLPICCRSSELPFGTLLILFFRPLRLPFPFTLLPIMFGGHIRTKPHVQGHHWRAIIAFKMSVVQIMKQTATRRLVMPVVARNGRQISVELVEQKMYRVQNKDHV